MASGRAHMYGDVTGHMDWRFTLCSAVNGYFGIVRMVLCHGWNFDQIGLQRRREGFTWMDAGGSEEWVMEFLFQVQVSAEWWMSMSYVRR